MGLPEGRLDHWLVLGAKQSRPHHRCFRLCVATLHGGDVSLSFVILITSIVACAKGYLPSRVIVPGGKAVMWSW